MGTLGYYSWDVNCGRYYRIEAQFSGPVCEKAAYKVDYYCMNSSFAHIVKDSVVVNIIEGCCYIHEYNAVYVSLFPGVVYYMFSDRTIMASIVVCCGLPSKWFAGKRWCVLMS